MHFHLWTLKDPIILLYIVLQPLSIRNSNLTNTKEIHTFHLIYYYSNTTIYSVLVIFDHSILWTESQSLSDPTISQNQTSYCLYSTLPNKSCHWILIEISLRYHSNHIVNHHLCLSSYIISFFNRILFSSERSFVLKSYQLLYCYEYFHQYLLIN